MSKNRKMRPDSFKAGENLTNVSLKCLSKVLKYFKMIYRRKLERRQCKNGRKATPPYFIF